jgi:hypothetical protein
MNHKQQEILLRREQSMRDHAISISNDSVKMEDIDQFAARNALKGIIQYLNEVLAQIPETITLGELADKGVIPS